MFFQNLSQGVRKKGLPFPISAQGLSSMVDSSQRLADSTDHP